MTTEVTGQNPAAGRVLEGVEIDQKAPIETCRSCGKPVWWGFTKAGKRNPFDVEGDDQRTSVTHFSTCSTPELFRKKR